MMNKTNMDPKEYENIIVTDPYGESYLLSTLIKKPSERWKKNEPMILYRNRLLESLNESRKGGPKVSQSHPGKNTFATYQYLLNN